MRKCFCDRCGKEMNFYEAYALGISACYNEHLKLTELKDICADCKKEIENFINGEKKDED